MRREEKKEMKKKTNLMPINHNGATREQPSALNNRSTHAVLLFYNFQ
jgi:hypothetical protein